MVIQTGIAAPLVLALLIRTARQREAGIVQRPLFWMLVMIISWMVGLTLESRDDIPRAWVALFVLAPACFMAPTFLMIMLKLARLDRVLDRRGSVQMVLAPFGFFLAAFLTHDWHGWMAPATARAGADEAVGPLYWAFQAWSNLVALSAIELCIHIGRTTPAVRERRRVGLLCAGGLVPLLTHALYTFDLLPLDYPLTPSALAVTALLLVAAIGNLRLLEANPIARRDVVESSTDGVLVADIEEFIVDVNPAAAQFMGATLPEVLGDRVADAIARLGELDPPEAVPGLIDGLRQGRQGPPSKFGPAAAGRSN